MDRELKNLYIHTLKYKYKPISQSIMFCEVDRVWGYRIYARRRSKDGVSFFLKEKNK